jgi:thioesterase domain-containing protein
MSLPDCERTGLETEDNTDRTPFFCVPGLGGSVLHLHALAQRVGTAHRVIALRTGLASETRRPGSVEELAAQSVETILRRQQSGPFLLGGYSGGALIAFEVARQLTARGHSVGLLALIDTRRPGWRLTRRNLPAVIYHFVRNLRGWVRDDLAQSSARQTWRNACRHLRALRSSRPNVERIIDLSRYAADMQQAMQKDFEMLEAYRPQGWAGRITLLRAATQPLFLLHDSRALGWSELAEFGVDVVTVPGNHLTIMQEPCVAALAAALNRCIDAALSRRDGSAWPEAARGSRPSRSLVVHLPPRPEIAPPPPRGPLPMRAYGG